MKKSDLISLFDINESKATNSSAAFQAFYYRSIYDCHFFNQAVFDLWHEQPYFGKIDTSNLCVIPRADLMRPISGPDEELILVLSPIAELWFELKNSIEVQKLQVGNYRETVFTKLKPSIGWQDASQKNTQYNEVLYNSFVGKFLNKERNEKIIDFPSFISVYLEFVEIMHKITPFTREGFLLSSFVHPSSSGLLIEIENKNSYDKDQKKIDIINDPSFNKFTQYIKDFGFELDKNVPWRLIPDLESTAMRNKLIDYNSSPETFYDDFFIRTHETELDNFKFNLWSWYEALFFIPQKQTINPDLFKKVSRKRYSQDEFFNLFPSRYFIRIYAYVRALEANKKWTQTKFNNVVSRAEEIMDSRKIWESSQIEVEGNLVREIGESGVIYYLYKELIEFSQYKGNQIFDQKDLTKKQVYDILDKRIKDSFKSFSYY